MNTHSQLVTWSTAVSYLYTVPPQAFRQWTEANYTWATLPFHTAELHSVNIEEAYGDATVSCNFKHSYGYHNINEQRSKIQVLYNITNRFHSKASIIQANYDRGSWVNQIIRMIKQARECYQIL